MKITTKIDTKRIKIFLLKLQKIIGEHFFLSFLFTVLISLIFGGVIFYRYVFLAENVAFNILERPVFFNVDVYGEVLEEISNREKIIQELDLKHYSNPFAPISGEISPIQPQD